MAFGGVDQGNLAFDQVVNGRASEEWGNLKTLGGISTGAETLGQEQLLQQAASGRIQMMQQVVMDVTKECIEAIAWYLWNDPLVKIDTVDKIPGTSVEMEVSWPHEQDQYGQQQDLRQGEFNDMNFDIVPYSLTDKPPAQRLQNINGVVNMLIPLLPLLQQQGVIFDAQAWLDIVKRYSGEEELGDILKTGDVPDPEQQMTNVAPIKPAGNPRQPDTRVRGGGKPDSMAALIAGMGSPKKPGAA
jgi:hypothetical protein